MPEHEECCMENGDLSGGATISAEDVPDEARAEEERLEAEYAGIEDDSEDEPATNADNVDEDELKEGEDG